MKSHVKGQVNFLVVSLFALAIGGCGFSVGGLLPTTKYPYPNSNVQPLGPAEGSSTKYGFLGAPPIDQEMLDEAVGQAVKQKGGDMLINGKFTAKSTLVPFVGWTTLSIKGTAAKMTIGKQELR